MWESQLHRFSERNENTYVCLTRIDSTCPAPVSISRVSLTGQLERALVAYALYNVPRAVPLKTRRPRDVCRVRAGKRRGGAGKYRCCGENESVRRAPFYHHY